MNSVCLCVCVSVYQVYNCVYCRCIKCTIVCMCIKCTIVCACVQCVHVYQDLEGQRSPNLDTYEDIRDARLDLDNHAHLDVDTCDAHLDLDTHDRITTHDAHYLTERQREGETERQRDRKRQRQKDKDTDRQRHT